MKRRRWSQKVARKVAAQRSPELRAGYQARRLYWSVDDLVFVDESGANERTGDRKRGWSPIGYPCATTQSLHRSERWSILPALGVNGYLNGTLVVQGAITREIFFEWLRDTVLTQCHTGQIIIIDNASIHRSVEVAELYHDAGVLLQFLPSYSPDFNPIEQTFNVLKTWIKRHKALADDFPTFGDFLVYAVEQ